MITEDYVSIETAKLLKEKGYDWEESPFYSEQDRDEWRHNNSYEIPNPTYNKDIPFDSEIQIMVAPHISIQMAMKWLREVHNLVICVEIGNENYKGNTDYSNPDRWYWFFDITNKKGVVIDTESDYILKEYSSYEESCEAAIKYCLENLI